MATRTWKTSPGTTAWALASNWVEGAVPTTSDDVIIPGGYNGSIDFSTSARNCGSLTVQSGSGAGVTFIGSGGLTVAGLGASRVFTLQSNTKWNATGTISFTNTTGCDITAPTVTAIQASFTLGSSSTTSATWKIFSYIFAASTRTLTLGGGNLNLIDNTFEIGLFSSSSTVTRSIAFGSTGWLLLTSATTSTVFNMATGTGFTYTGISYIVIQASIGGTSTITRTINTSGLTASNCMNFAIRDDVTFNNSGSSATDFITITTGGYFLTLDLGGVTGGYAYSRAYTGTLTAATARYIVGHLFLTTFQKLGAPSNTHSIIFADGATSSNTIVATNGNIVTLGTAASYSQGTSITIAASGMINSSTATNVITSGTTYFVAATTVNTTTVTLAGDAYYSYYDYQDNRLIFSTSTVSGTNTVSVGTVKVADFGRSVNLPSISFTGSSSYYIVSDFSTVYDLLISTSGSVYNKEPDYISGYTFTIGRNLTQTNGTLWNGSGGYINVTGVISWTNGTLVFEDGENNGGDYITCASITITAPYTINVDPYNNLTAIPRSTLAAQVTLNTGKPTITGTPTILKGRKFGFKLNATAALSSIADTTGLFSYVFNGNGTINPNGMVMRDVDFYGALGVISYTASYTVRGSFYDYNNSYASGTSVGGTITLLGSGGTQSDPDYIGMGSTTRNNVVINGSYYFIQQFSFATVGYVQFTGGTVYVDRFYYGTMDVTALYVTIASGVTFNQGYGTRFTVTGNSQTVFGASAATFAAAATFTGSNLIGLTLSSAATSGTRTIDCGSNGSFFDVFFTYPAAAQAKDTVSISSGTTFNSFDASNQDGTLSIPSMSVVGNFASSNNVGVVSGTLTLVNSDPNATNSCLHTGATSPNFNVILNGKNTVAVNVIGNNGTTVGTLTVNSGTCVLGNSYLNGFTVNAGATLQLYLNAFIYIASGYNVSISSLARVIPYGSGVGKISMQGTGAHTFAGGNHTFDSLELGGTGAVTITGNNTFNTISNSNIPCTLYLTAGSTTTMTTFYIQGTSSLRSTVIATSTAGATIKKPTRWSVGLNSSLVRTSGLYAESNAAYTATNYINFSDLTALVAPGVLSSLRASAFLNFF
jgi:hypothetical protein